MDSNPHKIKSSSLVNILTLRYDPSLIPTLPKKISKDFESKQEQPDIESIEKSICNNIEVNLEKFNIRKSAPWIAGTYSLPDNVERYIVKGQG